MKSLKITLVAAVIGAIFASLTPQDKPVYDNDKNNTSIVKVTFKKEKKGIKIPQEG